jgi:recombination protein RecA
MARPKKNDDNFFADLASFGGKLLADQNPVKYYIDSGNLAVNFLCSGRFLGGGYPGGRIIQILGPSMGGKSLWGTSFARGLQAVNGIPYYLDTENALNPEFAARASHVNPRKFYHLRPEDGIDCLERVFLKINNVMRGVREKLGPDVPLGFIYDSISVSPPERELRETTISENFTEAEWKKKVGKKEQPGERARICNKELRKLGAILGKNNTTILIINQVRDKIGCLYGNPEVGAVADTVLKFYSDVLLRVSGHAKIENKLGRKIGVNLKVKNQKNRIHEPFWEAEDVQLFYKNGVNPLSGLLTVLIQAERIEAAGKGVYIVKEPWAAGKEIKFRASKAKNMVDAEVLLQCPALIDAGTEQEVVDYLAIFKDSIDMTLSDGLNEKEIKDSDELLDNDFESNEE